MEIAKHSRLGYKLHKVPIGCSDIFLLFSILYKQCTQKRRRQHCQPCRSLLHQSQRLEQSFSWQQ